MRALAFLALAVLAGCNSPTPAPEVADDDRIECRIGNARQFDRFCTVERITGPDGMALTIRKPDGGFRRLLVTDDGRGVVAADGAEEAVVTILGDNRIEVAIAGDTFRLPATVRR